MNGNTVKTIALGVTGSIAAYKAAEICSRLVQAGVDVNVLMTEAATKLVGERTFLTLSRNPVVSNLWNVPEWRPEHIELAERTSLLVVAPCSANFIAKHAAGIADDALTTYALAHDGPVILAPAMNPRMWAHPATRTNVGTLKERGVEFVGPVDGRVACGEGGVGRMSDVDSIVERSLAALNAESGR